jgi:hypothetical protein
VANPDRCQWKYFCWVRVVDVTKPVRRTPAPPPVPAGPLPSPAPLASNLPPTETWRTGYRQVMGPGGHPPAVSPNASGPVGKPSSNQQSCDPTAVWSAVDGFHGREGELTAFDHGPAFSDEFHAKDWIANDPDGQQWDKESLNRFLMSFTFTPSGVAP